MSEQEQRGVINLGRAELDPQEAEDYRTKIARARAGNTSALKGSSPLRPKTVVSGVATPRTQQSDASPMTAEGGVQARPAGSPILRPETVQQLNDATKAQEQAVVEETKKEIEKEAEKEKADLFEVFDFGGQNEAERVLNNKKRRKEIEGRCEPMKLEDLIMKDEVRQVVPIVPNSFEVTYRSMTPVESLYIKKLMADEKGSDQYIMEKYSVYVLACSLVAINGVELPHHRNAKGEVDDDSFNKKVSTILRKSGYIVADLGVNFFWFDVRVRKLLNPDDLKNG